jgi:hypothetical protein
MRLTAVSLRDTVLVRILYDVELDRVLGETTPIEMNGHSQAEARYWNSERRG